MISLIRLLRQKLSSASLDGYLAKKPMTGLAMLSGALGLMKASVMLAKLLTLNGLKLIVV